MTGYNKGINNPMYGRKLSLEAIQKVRSAKMGENNPAWRGDKIGVKQLHLWVRSRKPKPEFCEMCRLIKPLDLANLNGAYKRGFENWIWLCRKCHQISDGRYENLKLMGNKNLKLRWRRE